MVSRTLKLPNLVPGLKCPALKKWILQSVKRQKHSTVCKAHPLSRESLQCRHSSPEPLLPHACFIPLVGRCRGPQPPLQMKRRGPGILSDACRAMQLGMEGLALQLPHHSCFWSPFLPLPSICQSVINSLKEYFISSFEVTCAVSNTTKHFIDF